MPMCRLMLYNNVDNFACTKKKFANLIKLLHITLNFLENAVVTVDVTNYYLGFFSNRVLAQQVEIKRQIIGAYNITVVFNVTKGNNQFCYFLQLFLFRGCQGSLEDVLSGIEVVHIEDN